MPQLASRLITHRIVEIHCLSTVAYLTSQRWYQFAARFCWDRDITRSTLLSAKGTNVGNSMPIGYTVHG